MSQWGFYFNQDRCLGCKTCVTACKNWNDRFRGDSNINKSVDMSQHEHSVGENENKDTYLHPDTGETNYELYRKYYMKENWRKVTEVQEGAVTVDKDGTYTSTLDRCYVSLGCNHCEKPVCVDVCPMAVYAKDKNTGIVKIVNGNCISCGKCKEACPWNVPQFYDNDFAKYSQSDPKRPKATKCTLCSDRIGENLKPACVAACWNRALDAGPISELKSKYSGYEEEVKGFAEGGTLTSGEKVNPNIIFKKKQERKL